MGYENDKKLNLAAIGEAYAIGRESHFVTNAAGAVPSD